MKKKIKTVKCEYCKFEIPIKQRKYGLCCMCWDAYLKLSAIVELYKGDENG